MEVKVQLKHLIIVGLVVTYTFGSILFALTNQIYNPTLNVAFIYDSLELGVENDANQVWEALNTIQKEMDFETINSHYDSIELQNVNLSGSMIDHIGEYAVKNEVITIFGDSYNEEIDEVIEQNPQTSFIMIDSNYEQEYNNLSIIEIDNTNRIEEIAKQIEGATKTKKILFIASSEDAQEQYDTFKSEIDERIDSQVTPLIFDDASDNVTIKKELLAELNEGYDSIYVATRELNKIVIETAKEVQVDIIDDRAQVDLENLEIEESNNAIDLNNAGNETDETAGENDQFGETKAPDDEAAELSVNQSDEEYQVSAQQSILNPNAEVDDEEDLEDETSEERELLEYKYEQELINVYVSGSSNISNGIYYTDETNEQTKNVVRAYIDLNIEEVLSDIFVDILTNTATHSTIYLGFNNEGLELIKE